jgi:phage tail-like protein
MATIARDDPFGQFNFLLEIDGMAKAGFTEVSGLSTETSVIEYHEAGRPPRKLPGITNYSNITLKRGLTKDRSLWDWRKTVIDGALQRKNGSVVLLDGRQQEVARWIFHDAWPCKWEASSLHAESSEVAIETLELAHNGFDLA